MARKDGRFVLPKAQIWALHKSKTTNKYYYYNILTGKAYWERPRNVKDDEIYFPESAEISDLENVECEVVDNRSKNKLKRSEKDYRGPKKDEQHNKKRKRNIEEPTATVSNHSARKQCKKNESAKHRKKISRKIQPKRLEDTTESELPSYTDSDEDRPSAAKKGKKTDEKANKCQSKTSEEECELQTGDSSSVSEVVTEQNGINDQQEDMDWSPDSSNNNNNDLTFESDSTEWPYLENEVTPMEIDISSVEDVCIVVDTNIIIHELPLVQLLANFQTGSGKIFVIIPWQVLKELDHLKHKSAFKAYECRRAIEFLHKCFSDKSSNVIAQNACTAQLGRDLFEIEVPDDHVLACSLQTMGHGRRTILISNDKNLCNKARAHNIEAYTQEQFHKIINFGKSSANGTINYNRNSDNPPVQKDAPVQKSIIPPSVQKNLLPRRTQSVRTQTEKNNNNNNNIFTSFESGFPHKTPEKLPQKRKIPPNCNTNSKNSLNQGLPYKAPETLPQKRFPNCITSSPLKVPSSKTAQNIQNSSNQGKNMDLPFKVKYAELLEYVKLSPPDYMMTTNKMRQFKVILAEFLFSVLKEGMSKTFKGKWQKRVTMKPPWTVEQLCLCVEKHWMSLTDLFLPEDIRRKLRSLRDFITDIGKDTLTLTDFEIAVNYCSVISSSLKKHFKSSVEKFEEQLKNLQPIFESERNYWTSEFLEIKGKVPYPRSSRTKQTDSSGCCIRLSRIWNETSEFLSGINRCLDSSSKSGILALESHLIPILSDKKRSLPKKINLIRKIICCFLEIIEGGSDIPEASITKLASYVSEEKECCDPFLSNDVERFAKNRDHVQDYWKKYEELRRNLLMVSKRLHNLRCFLEEY